MSSDANGEAWLPPVCEDSERSSMISRIEGKLRDLTLTELRILVAFVNTFEGGRLARDIGDDQQESSST